MAEIPTKFTQEIKDNWLAALKSGKYKQIKGSFITDKGLCCLGVLACNGNYPRFLTSEIRSNLIEANDKTFDSLKPDYSNVIPLIEQLPVQQ